MSYKVFFISDTHFGHEGAYKYTNYDGTPMRPWDSAEEGDAVMAERWNSVVGPKDKVFHLGDVAIPRRGLKVLEPLNGRKILVAGNHDIFKLKDYMPYFEDICGTRKYKDFTLSHVPQHPDCLPHWAKANLHGHLHNNTMKRIDEAGNEVVDTRYFNVAVERINYTPMDFDEIVALFE